MICPKCGFPQAEDRKECKNCGVIFSKLTAADYQGQDAAKVESKNPASAKNISASVKKILSEEEVATGTVIFAARALFFLILFFWGWGFIFSALKGEYSGDSVLHYVNLVFHEAGHIIFWGKFMAVLGGSLMQIIIPGCCVASFLYYRNPFAAAAALWWLAENFMDMAPYINDARALQLPLLGGITGSDDPDSHDWHFLLRETGWLEYDQILARLSSHIGILLMITSFAWMIWTLRQQFKSIRSYKSAL